MMDITVNGEEKKIPDSVNIKYLIGLYGLAPEKVAIEHNGKILKNEEWGKVVLKNEDKIEIVSFVGGG